MCLQRRRQRRDLIRQKLFLKLLGSFCRRSGADSFLPVSALPRSFHGHEATSRLRTCTQRAQRAARSRDLCARPGRGCQPGALHCVLAPLPRGLEGPPCCPQGLAHPGSRGRHPNTPEMEAGSLPSPAGPDACTARSLGMRSGPFPAPASHGAKELFHGLILSGNGARSARGSPPALVKRRVRGRLGWRAGPETAALGMLLLRESKLNSGMGLTTCLEVENDRGDGKWRRRLSLSLLASPGPGPVPGPPGCQQVAGAPAVQGQVLAVELVCAGTQKLLGRWSSQRGVVETNPTRNH